MVVDNVFIGSFDQATGNYEDPNALCNHYAVSTFTTYFSSAYGWTDIVGDIHVKDNVMNNLYLGIGSFAGGGEIESNTISGNVIGIQLGQVSGTWATAPTAGLNIVGNIITDNTLGIWVQDIVPDGIMAHFNNIVGNTEYGVLNEDPDSDVFDASHNWWGDPEGPTVGGPAMSGDAVSDNVIYQPWLISPVMDDPDGTGAIASSKSGTDTILNYPDSNVKVLISGSATVYVATYDSNPGKFLAGDIGNYIDVYVPDTTDLTEIEIRKYYSKSEISDLGLYEPSLKMYWWNGVDWVPCSETGVNIELTYIWARIGSDTEPSLDDLTGAAFAAAGATGPVGGEILSPRANEVSLLMNYAAILLIATAISAGLIIAHRKRWLLPNP